MRRMKNLSYDYSLKLCHDPENLSGNDNVRINFNIWLDHTSYYDKDTSIFFNVFSGSQSAIYWLRVSDNYGTYNLQCNKIQELPHAACTLARKRHNIYFCPNAFSASRIDINTKSSSVIFIDIDDVDGTDFSAISTDELTDWLMNTYCLFNDMLPN